MSAQRTNVLAIPRSGTDSFADERSHRLRLVKSADALSADVQLTSRTVALCGELDIAGRGLLSWAAEQLLAACRPDPKRRSRNDDGTDASGLAACCDLRDLRFIDAGGIGALVCMRAAFDAADIPLRFASAPARVRRVLALCQLEELLTDEPDPNRSPAHSREA